MYINSTLDSSVQLHYMSTGEENQLFSPNLSLYIHYINAQHTAPSLLLSRWSPTKKTLHNYWSQSWVTGHPSNDCSFVFIFRQCAASICGNFSFAYSGSAVTRFAAAAVVAWFGHSWDPHASFSIYSPILYSDNSRHLFFQKKMQKRKYKIYLCSLYSWYPYF